jgi:hypothetical protein
MGMITPVDNQPQSHGGTVRTVKKSKRKGHHIVWLSSNSDALSAPSGKIACARAHGPRTRSFSIFKFLLYIFNGREPVGLCRESAKLPKSKQKSQQKSQQIILGRKSAKLA